jgi:nicotinamide/nicotinate riboside kinase
MNVSSNKKKEESHEFDDENGFVLVDYDEKEEIIEHKLRGILLANKNKNKREETRRLVVVGMSGCSCSGKTTLATLLKSHIDELNKTKSEPVTVHHVNMDDFYRTRDRQHMPYLPELATFNFDTIRSLDLAKFHSHLHALVTSVNSDNNTTTTRLTILIVEGFLLYDDELLFPLLDRRYFLHLGREECMRRRALRTYQIDEVAGYAEQCMWPAYCAYMQRLLLLQQLHKSDTTAIVFVDGERSIDHNFNFILRDLFHSLSI